MDLQEARKQAATLKPQENFLLVNIAYDFSLVLPYKEGIAVMAALANAEYTDPSYSSKKQILPVPQSRITATTMSHQEYARCKTAQILGMSYSDLEKLEEEEREKIPF